MYCKTEDETSSNNKTDKKRNKIKEKLNLLFFFCLNVPAGHSRDIPGRIIKID
jgi:hypothetical protein